MGHHGHDHTAAARDGNRRALAVVLALTASFTVV
jgi:Co/Zn/Cd efflux system component